MKPFLSKLQTPKIPGGEDLKLPTHDSNIGREPWSQTVPHRTGPAASPAPGSWLEILSHTQLMNH